MWKLWFKFVFYGCLNRLDLDLQFLSFRILDGMLRLLKYNISILIMEMTILSSLSDAFYLWLLCTIALHGTIILFNCIFNSKIFSSYGRKIFDKIRQTLFFQIIFNGSYSNFKSQWFLPSVKENETCYYLLVSRTNQNYHFATCHGYFHTLKNSIAEGYFDVPVISLSAVAFIDNSITWWFSYNHRIIS